MGLLFFPRGGSSHVAQNLAAALPGAGWQPTVLSGSLSLPGRPGDARAFYHGLDVHTVDFTPALDEAGAAAADVLHLHHLTPLYEAAARVAPAVPLVGHLHGTELLMLEAIEDGGASWPHGAAWEQRMRAWAARCERLIVLSDNQVHRAERLLGIDGARC